MSVCPGTSLRACDSWVMRWIVASVAFVAVVLLTFPVLAAGGSEGPGECTSAVGLQTLGNGESCDAWGAVVVLPAAVLVFVLIALGWKHLRVGRDLNERAGPTVLTGPMMGLNRAFGPSCCDSCPCPARSLFAEDEARQERGRSCVH